MNYKKTYYISILVVLQALFLNKTKSELTYYWNFKMAVPKKKTSKCKRNQRRSHHALKPTNVVIDPTTGEFKLSHHISLKDGYYKGRQVLIAKEKSTEAETA